MSRIRTLIVDDEKPALRALRLLLAQDRDIEIVGEATDGARGLELLRETQPQLLFLDIEMPLLNGFAVLEQLPPAARPEIVFVTAYDHYAHRAFDVEAVDYLVKPFSDARFRAAVERAKQRLHRGSLASTEQALHALLAHLRNGPGSATVPATTSPLASASVRPAAVATNPDDYARLVVKADGQLHFLNQRDIRWVEGQADFVRLHLKGRSLLTRMTMTAAERALDPAQFVRIHKSTIVNLRCVRRIIKVLARSQGMELDDGVSLTIGPSYRDVLDRLR